MDSRTIAGIVAGLLTIVAFLPVLISVHRKKLRPHRTSWFIWSATYIVILAEQISTQAGPIIIRTAVSGLIALYFFVYAVQHQIYKFSRRTLYPMAFIVAISIYANFFAAPLQTILIMCAVCSAALLPQAIKIYRDPWSESLTLISANGIASIFALLSLGSNPTIPKLVFPIFVLGATGVLIAITSLKRKYYEQRPTMTSARLKFAEIKSSYLG